MTQNTFPFHETAEDATNTSIIRSGVPFKKVAGALWPEMKLDSAYARLKNCLRPDAREHLMADQHLFIANYVGEYDFLYYACHRCQHSKPDPVEPEDAKAELMERFIEAADSLGRMYDEIRGASEHKMRVMK